MGFESLHFLYYILSETGLFEPKGNGDLVDDRGWMGGSSQVNDEGYSVVLLHRIKILVFCHRRYRHEELL